MTLLRFHNAETLRSWHKHGILAAVSGGADSTALLHCLVEAFAERSKDGFSSGKLAVAHINHGLRGKESDTDAVFVQQCAERYALPYFEYRIQPEEWNAKQNTGQNKCQTGSSEDIARTIRYRFLTRTAEEQGFRYIAAAHTADDQTETVLHRVFRGTGLAGLAGIRPFRRLSEAVTLIRPLLKNTRKEILDYLRTRNLSFRVDSSNFENRFTRNRIRNRLLPLIREECNPQADAAVHRLAQLAEENEIVLDELFQILDEQIIVRQTENGWVLDRSALRRWSRPTLREWFVRLWKQGGLPLREMGLRQWETLIVFLSDDFQRLELPGKVLVRKEEHLIYLQTTR